MMATLWALIQVILTVAGAWALGRGCRGSRWSYTHAALNVAADAALGLLIVSQVLLALTFLGLARPGVLAVLLAGLAGAALFGLSRLERKDFSRLWIGVRLNPRMSASVLVAAVSYLLWIVFEASLPITFIDELIYHLEVPRQLLLAGGQTFFQDNIYAYFPQLGEMFFLFGMALGGELAARLIHAAFGILLAAALYGFSRRYVSPGLSLLSSALFLSIPSVMVLSSLAYVDLMFALYGFLALAALLEYFREPGLGRALPVGLMAGGAWAAKYTGLQFLMLLVLALLVEQLLARRKTIPWGAVVLFVSALVWVLPYLIRNWWLTGWPLFPFDLGYLDLNSSVNWDRERSGLFLTWLSRFGSGKEGLISGKLLAPVFVFLKARFNVVEAYDGMVGPVFLLTPFLLFRVRKSREIRVLILFGLAFLYYWAFTTQQVRFLLPVLPVLCFLLAFGLSAKKSRLVRALVLALTLVNVGFGVRQTLTLNPAAFWSGRESAVEYQSKRIVGYPLYREANRLLNEDDRLYLVNMRNFGYLLECRWRADFIFEYYRLGRALEEAASSGEIADFFRRQEITHLMIDEDITLSPRALAARERRLLVDFLQRHATLLSRNPAQPGQSLWKLAP